MLLSLILFPSTLPLHSTITDATIATITSTSDDDDGDDDDDDDGDDGDGCNGSGYVDSCSKQQIHLFVKTRKNTQQSVIN